MLDAERDERAARSSTRQTSIGGSGNRTAVDEAGASKKDARTWKERRARENGASRSAKAAQLGGRRRREVSLNACKPREEASFLARSE